MTQHPRRIEAGVRQGFFTDTSVCIGCKACEVACKEWNELDDAVGELTGRSYDNTSTLDALSWRHVAFVEKPAPVPTVGRDLVWLMSSDVCKHCTEAACLDVCPTGSLFRTEFGTVVVQPDICNGCGYCVPACPFGVIGKEGGHGGAAKCTLCYDRLKADQVPACAQACPTESIQFGPLVDMAALAASRLEALQLAGVIQARLYGADPDDGIGGAGALFLLLDEPAVYGLPSHPHTATRHLGQMWTTAAQAAAALSTAVAVCLLGTRR